MIPVKFLELTCKWYGGCVMSVLETELFLKLGFTPSKAEQPLRGMELQEKEAKKRLNHIGNLFRKNLQLIGAC